MRIPIRNHCPRCCQQHRPTPIPHRRLPVFATTCYWGKAVKNYAPGGFKELAELFISFSYYNYNDLGQLSGTAQRDGEKMVIY